MYGQHVDVDEGRDLGQEVFEPREQRRIVDRPFRVFGRVPLRHGQAVRRGQPVAVDLEIRGEAVHNPLRALRVALAAGARLLTRTAAAAA